MKPSMPLHSPRAWDSWLAGDGAATIAAALVGALIVVIGYFIQQRFVRGERRALAYSEALRAVEDYMESPFLISRRDGSPAERRKITDHVSAVQSRIAYHQAELAIHASDDISAGYTELVRAARLEAGAAMTLAWRRKPARSDRRVPLGSRFSRERTDEAMKKLVRLMRSDVH